MNSTQKLPKPGVLAIIRQQTLTLAYMPLSWRQGRFGIWVSVPGPTCICVAAKPKGATVPRRPPLRGTAASRPRTQKKKVRKEKCA